jgi:hypothetical protein
MSSRPTLPLWCADYRADMEVFNEYDRLININHEAMDGPLAPVPVVKTMFECGLFMVIHGPGVPMNSHWSRTDGNEVGWLQFGEKFVVTEVSMDHSGGRVRALVERCDGISGWISMYSTGSMQQFVASMDGVPPWSSARDLLRPLIRSFRESPPLAFFAWAVDPPRLSTLSPWTPMAFERF